MRNLLFSATALFAAALLVSSSVVDAQTGHDHGTHQAAKPATAAKTPMKPAPAGPLPPLPAVSFQPVRPLPIAQQVYEFAARHPEVLQYIPCYCGCERVGHNGNHDCFVKSRAANGRITEWDTHGLGCAVCLDVGREAMTMHARGMSVQAIRTAIDAKYGPHFPSSTPTPQPPKAPARKS